MLQNVKILVQALNWYNHDHLKLRVKAVNYYNEFILAMLISYASMGKILVINLVSLVSPNLIVIGMV